MMTQVDSADVSSGLPGESAIEARLTKLDSEISVLKLDVAVIKANGATKTDVAEAKSAIIMWVAGIVFLAQLLPATVRLIEKYF
jgi:predicted metal-binding membrane protein